MKKIFILNLLIVFLFLFSVNVVMATCNAENGSHCPPTLPNPLGSQNPDINEIIGTVINAILGIVGSLALAMFIYGGFTWMTAGGASEKVQKGKDIIIWATIGLIVIFSSYALVYFVLNNLIGGGNP